MGKTIRQCALIDWPNGELDQSEARKLGSCEQSEQKFVNKIDHFAIWAIKNGLVSAYASSKPDIINNILMLLNFGK